MRAHGHAPTWGTHIGVGRAHDTKHWYQELKAWWTTHKAVHRDAKIAALNAQWDARREAVRVPHADAACDLVAVEHAASTATALCELSI